MSDRKGKRGWRRWIRLGETAEVVSSAERDGRRSYLRSRRYAPVRVESYDRSVYGPRREHFAMICEREGVAPPTPVRFSCLGTVCRKWPVLASGFECGPMPAVRG